MQKYQDVVLNQNGNPVSGVQVTVTDLAGSPVAVYSSNAIGLNVNPLTSDNNGRFSFYAPDGRYSLTFTFGGNVVASITDILLEDPMDGSDAVFNDVTILGGLSDASKITSTAAGGLSSTNVQAALEELDGEKIDASSLAASGGSALVGFQQAGTGAVAATVQGKLRESVSVFDFMTPAQIAAVQAGTSTDDYAAIMAAINSLGVNGGTVLFPRGTYKVGTTIELTTCVRLQGTDTGLAAHAGRSSSKLVFASNIHGIIVQRHNTTGISGTTASRQSGGDGSEIVGLELNGSGTTGHGIAMRARASIKDCRVYYFGQNGIHIAAASDANQAPLGNANSWRIDSVRVSGCGGHGLYTIGADANAGTASMVDCEGNSGWGIYDSAFLGNAYVGCHVSGNTTGSYKADAGACVFIGCYSEGGTPASQINSPSLAIGGTHGAGFSSTQTGPYLKGNSGYLLNQKGYWSTGVDGAANIDVILGGNPANGDIFFASHSTNSPSGWRLRLIQSGKDLRFDYGNSDTSVTYRITGPNTGLSFARPVYVPHAFVTDKLWIGTNDSARYHGTGSAEPTTGTYAKGDIIWNNNPSAGGFAGWICVATGTPGTWKTFGAISA